VQVLEKHQSQTFGHGRLHPSLLVCLSFQRAKLGCPGAWKHNKGSHMYVLALPQGPFNASMLGGGKPDDKFFTMKAMAYMLIEQPPTMCMMANKSHNTWYSRVPTHNQTLSTTIHHSHEVNRLSPLLCIPPLPAGLTCCEGPDCMFAPHIFYYIVPAIVPPTCIREEAIRGHSAKYSSTQTPSYRSAY